MSIVLSQFDGTKWKAQVKGQNLWAIGNTRAEAIGNLILTPGRGNNTNITYDIPVYKAGRYQRTINRRVIAKIIGAYTFFNCIFRGVHTGVLRDNQDLAIDI